MDLKKKTYKLLTISLIILCLGILITYGLYPIVINIYNKTSFHFLGDIITKINRGHSLNSYPLEDVLNRIRAIIVGLIGFCTTFISLWLIILHYREDLELSKRQLILFLFLVILNGTIIRLILAYMRYGNFDMESYETVLKTASEGKNIYLTYRYNYTPLWFYILEILKIIQTQFFMFPFHFIVKSFLCGIDLLTLLFVIFISKIERISIIKASLFFYFNPVSFLLTGYHGQFENIAILMILIGIFGYLRLKNDPILGKIILWIFVTIGMIVKHNIFYQLIICLNYAVKKYWKKIPLFLISVSFFLMMFIPYLTNAEQHIINNVFAYGAQIRIYGISSILTFPDFKNIFILSLFIYPLLLKSKNILKRCLLGMLFFLTFTTGIAVQFFILPIALGVLRYSKGFIAYSLSCSIFLLFHHNNINLPIELSPNIVWVSVIYWFVTEHYNINLQITQYNNGDKGDNGVRPSQGG